MNRGNFISSVIDQASQQMVEAESSGVSETMASSVSSSSEGPYLLLSGHAAANTSPNRAMLYWPTAKTKFELEPLAASEIRRRIHWLLANFGFARRLVWGMAQTAGTITPFADTGDDDWDTLVEENFLERASSPAIFDISANFDFWTVQNQLDVNRWKDGDCLIVPTNPGGYDGVQLAFFEGSQIGDEGLTRRNRPVSGRAWNEFRDGVKTDRYGKRTHFNVQDGVDPDRHYQIPAADSYYYANLENHHAVRGISILAAAVVNMIDVVETRSYTKKRLKEDVDTGKVIEQDNAMVISDGGGLGGQIIQTALPALPGTEASDQEVFVDWHVASGGGQIPTLPPGQKIKVVADTRPTPSARDFEDDLLRDSSYCTGGLPYEALFKIADLKGPASRFVLAQIRRWVSNQFHYKARFVRWYRALHISNEIEAGRLPRPREIKNKPLWWLKAAYIGQADQTIDEGRKGNLALVNLESGLTTWSKEWGEEGIFWKNPIRQRTREVAFAKRECRRASEEFNEDVSFNEAFPKLGAAAAPGDEPRDPNIAA